MIVETMPYACVIHGPDRAVQVWNPAAEHIFGWPAADMLGRNSIECTVPPEWRDRVNATIERARDSGAPLPPMVNENLTRDGRRIVCEWRNARLADASGAFVGYLSMAVDISGQAAARDALAESEARFKQLAGMASDWYWEADTEHRFTAFVGRTNISADQLQRLMGRRRWEVAGHTPHGTTWAAHMRLIDARAPFRDLLIEVVLPDDQRSFRTVSGQPRLDSQGRFAGYRGVGSDATEETLAAVTAAGERRMFEALAAGRTLETLLEILCEAMAGGLARKGLVSIHMARNGRLEAVAAPQLPADFRAALSVIAIDPDCGSCGSAAALGVPVAVRDIASDARWAGFREVALAAGIASSWSTPVIGADGGVLATICVYHFQPVDPFERDRRTAARMADLAGLVVQRFRAEADLRDSEARFRQLTLLSSDWYWEQDADFRFVATDAVARGDKPLGESVGMTRWERPGTRAIGITWAEHRADLEAHRPFAHLVLEVDTPDGLRRHVAVRGEPIFDSGGRFTGYRGVGADISERFRSEVALRRSEARFRQLTELSSDWYWEQDAEYRFIRVTGGELRKDLPYDTTVGYCRWERPSLRPVGFTWDEHKRDLDARKPFTNLIIEYTDPRSARNYWSLRGEPVFDESGAFAGYRGVGTDITQRHRLDLVRAGERRMFELLTAGAAIDQLIDELCGSVERALARPGVATVQVVEGAVLRPLGGAGASTAAATAGESGGLCATVLICNETVTCADFETDSRWEAQRPVAWACGFRSGWSTPVRGASGQVLATFAIYAALAAEPLAEDLEVTAAAAALAGVLIERFNAEAARRESEDRYRSLVELTQEGVLIHDERTILYANPAMARILRAADAQALLALSPIEIVEPESRTLAQSSAERIAGGETMQHAELRLRAVDRSVVDVEVSGAPIEIGGRRMIQSYIRDISARKWAQRELQRMNESLEQRVVERTAELTAANRELEAFSYTVAHDLRAPLRAIDGFANLLRHGAGDRLDEQALRDLVSITTNVRRMAELIDGLLEFSRLSRSATARQEVATRALVDAVIPEALVAAAHRPEFVIGDLAPVEGDAAMLRQVWINLIANAVKFTARARSPRIEITCRRDGGEIVFTVRDNGAGFDPRYQSKLFGIFQRLHAQTDYQGTGVGLAIVKRIVERHRGRVWAEGRPGNGAAFHFSLPTA